MAEESVGPGVVEWYGGGDRPGHRCGYCKSTNSNVSDGMWAHKLTVQDYQDLIDRGWRRSGKYCYKPKMDTTCCPHYTIKQDALNFKMSKSHKKIIKQFNKFLIHGKKKGEHDKPEGEESVKGGKADPGSKEETSVNHNSPREDKSMEAEQIKKTPKPGLGADPTKPKCKKAKDLRREKKLAKQTEKGQTETQADNTEQSKQQKSQEKTLEDLLREPEQTENCAHKLEIRLVRSEPASEEFTHSFTLAHNVYHSYQMIIHKDPPNKPSVAQYTRFLCDSPLEVRLVRVNPPSSEFQKFHSESYGIFKEYQMRIHKEDECDCSLGQFDDFLCEGPLEEEYREGGPPMGYGSFHQHYLLDGQIIAVGVIDILPSCVSSVYLYYDPDYDFLSLGTYSALREIAFVRELNKKAPDLKYYYMGYYIHSCPKMRYKGQYYPSFLLCPEVFSWHPIEECSPKLDKNKYSRFADPDKEDEGGHVDLDSVMILHRRMAMTYQQYKLLNPKTKTQHDDVVRKYAGFVGRSCATRMLLYRN